MKSSELRSGNYVYGYEYLGTKIMMSLSPCVDFGRDQINIEPIELTEEILLKLGFLEKTNINEDGDERDFYSISKDETYFALGNDFQPLEIDLDYELKYVHELQNLYYFCTKKELIFKD